MSPRVKAGVGFGGVDWSFPPEDLILPPDGAPQVIIDKNIDLQTMQGWEGTVQIGTSPFQAVRDEVNNRLVNELGVNRARLSLRSGQYSTIDVYEMWEQGLLTNEEERELRFATKEPSVFQPRWTQFQMDDVVIPMRNLLAARGESLWLNMSFNDPKQHPQNWDVFVDGSNSGAFSPDETVTWSGGSGRLIGHIPPGATAFRLRNSVAPNSAGMTITGASSGQTTVTTAASVFRDISAYRMRSNQQRAANLIVECLNYLQATYGFLPDSIELINEPDNDHWDLAQLSAGIPTIGSTLAANGYGHIPIITPAVARDYNAASWFNTIWSNTATRQYIDTLSFHCYGNRFTSTLLGIRDVAAAAGVKTAMLEYDSGMGGLLLHRLLKLAHCSAVQRFAMAFNFTGTSQGATNGHYYTVVVTDPNPATAVAIAGTSRQLRPYFFYIRQGAVRKQTTHLNCGALDPTNELHQLHDWMAFRNLNGKYVAVGHTASTATVWLVGLPAGTYGIEYSQGTGTWKQSMPDVTIRNGDALPVTPTSTGAHYMAVFQR